MITNMTKKMKNQGYLIYLIELLALLLLFLIGCLTIDGFFSTASIVSTLLVASFLGICAGGQTLVILLGAIDLSIPAIISCSAVLAGYLTGQGWPFYTIVLMLVVGAAIFGVINALVSKTLSINPLITTLATGAIIEGIMFVTTGGAVSSHPPVWLNQLSALNGHIGFIPIPPIIGIWILYSIIILLLLYKTSWGKRLYATGVNVDAAQLALVKTTRIWVAAFVLSAVSAVLAGLLLGGFGGSGYFDIGEPYLFMTIGAVVLGGTSVIGGRGGYGQTIFGALIITMINTITVGFGFDAALQQAFLGFIIVLLLSFYGRQQSIRLRM